MEKQTKILIGLAVLGAAAYFIFRPKADAKGSMPLGDMTVKCKDGTTDVGNGISLPCQGHGGVLGSNTSKFCPEGSTEEIEMCKQAPCPPSCKKNDGSGYIPCYMNPNCRALIAPYMTGDF